MRPTDQCKQAGLKNLKELADITRESVQTLVAWSKNKPRRFELLIAGAVSDKSKQTESGQVK